MNEYICVRKIWTDVWHPHRCGRPAKFYLDGIHGPIPLCGIHIRSERRAGRNVKDISALTDVSEGPVHD